MERTRCRERALAPETGGWLAGLRDTGIGRAIRLLHAEPAHHWTLTDLAREAGLSRTVLAERFSELLGMPPMTYLVNWRMQPAASMLSAGSIPLTQVAAAIGDESEAAFSRALKRSTALSPTQWRRNANPGRER
jgi:AraC-like DNA-binding protein